MIIKSWNKASPYYDSIFDEASDNLWNVWRDMPETDYKSFIKAFKCVPIRKHVNGNEGIWIGLKLKNKAKYMLFLLEWRNNGV
jgi:hypothetical protein